MKTKNQDAFFGRPIADCSATLARKVRQASALQPRPELSMQNPIGDATHVFTERVPSRHKHRCPGTVKTADQLLCSVSRRGWSSHHDDLGRHSPWPHRHRRARFAAQTFSTAPRKLLDQRTSAMGQRQTSAHSRGVSASLPKVVETKEETMSREQYLRNGAGLMVFGALISCVRRRVLFSGLHE